MTKDSPITVADALRALADKVSTLIEEMDENISTMKGAASGILPDGTPIEDMLAELKEEKANGACLRSLLRTIKHMSFCRASEASTRIKEIRTLIDEKKII